MGSMEEVGEKEADELEEEGNDAVGGEDPEGTCGHVVHYHVCVGVA